MQNSTRDLKLLYLGQCLQQGYEGVTEAETYPRLIVPMLNATFPDVRIKYELKSMYHPSVLKSLLRYRLPLSRPDVVLISLPALFTVIPWRLNWLYQVAPDLELSARALLQKIDAKVRGRQRGLSVEAAADQFAPLMPSVTHPPLQIEEYERLAEEGIRLCQSLSSCRIILIGPGGFNEYVTEALPPNAPQLWASVNKMVLRLGERMKVAVVNVHDLMEEEGSGVFLTGNIRFSVYGHDVVAREVASIIGAQVKTKGIDRA